jgi:hypothetical protein
VKEIATSVGVPNYAYTVFARLGAAIERQACELAAKWGYAMTQESVARCIRGADLRAECRPPEGEQA